MSVQSGVMIALGSYRFSIYGAGAEEFARSTEWRWPEQAIIGAPPASQYVGPGRDTISIRGVIFPHYRGGLGQIDAMRAQAGTGQPLTLVDGTGRYYGLYVIERVDEGRSEMLSDSAPRKIEFTVSLKRFN